MLFNIPGYFGKNYFDHIFERNKQIESFKDQKYKDLYKDGQPKVIALRDAIGELPELLSNSYGISTFEWEKYLSNLLKARQEYSEYISELESYGNDYQIASARELQSFAYNAFSDFSAQYRLAQKVQDSIHTMIIGTYQDSEIENPDKYAEFHVNKIKNELNEMIQAENRIYYRYSRFKMHVWKILSDQYTNSFRQSIGLDSTHEMSQSYKRLSDIDSMREDSEYKESPTPFFVAKYKSFLSGKFSADNDVLFGDKNSWFEMEAFGDFMNQVVENDPYLKKKAEENMKNASDVELLSE